MKTKITLLAMSIVLMLAGPVFAAEELAVTTSKPEIDGVIAPDEYSYVLTETGGEMVLYVNMTEDSLSVAISAETEGWIGVGLGEMRMNRSTIFMGFVTADGVTFSVENGQGHRHTTGDADIVTAYEMTESAGTTYLEIELPLDDWVRNRDRNIEVILGYGAADSLKPYHTYRGAVKVPIAR